MNLKEIIDNMDIHAISKKIELFYIQTESNDYKEVIDK